MVENKIVNGEKILGWGESDDDNDDVMMMMMMMMMKRKSSSRLYSVECRLWSVGSRLECFDEK